MIEKTMKAAVLEEVGRLVVKDIAMPAVKDNEAHKGREGEGDDPGEEVGPGPLELLPPGITLSGPLGPFAHQHINYDQGQDPVHMRSEDDVELGEAEEEEGGEDGQKEDPQKSPEPGQHRPLVSLPLEHILGPGQHHEDRRFVRRP